MYGKTVKNKHSSYQLVRAIEVPKKNFLHFYIFASIWVPFLLVQAIRVSYQLFFPSQAPLRELVSQAVGRPLNWMHTLWIRSSLGWIRLPATALGSS